MDFEKICEARHSQTNEAISALKSEISNDIKELKDGQKIIFTRINWFYTMVICALLTQFIKCGSVETLITKIFDKEVIAAEVETCHPLR